MNKVTIEVKKEHVDAIGFSLIKDLMQENGMKRYPFKCEEEPERRIVVITGERAA